jgi:rare lipoprotein A (RlpA)-like double-psi beta-barrel protein
MHTTTVDRHVRGSYPPVDTAVDTGCQPAYPLPASSLRRSCITHWQYEWMRMLLCCLLVTSVVVSCTSRSTVPPPTPPSPPPDTTPTPSFRIQYGLASWYGRERHGRRTASGEIFDTYQLVAAHRTAPFGTYALVTNLTNGRTVQVRINDRGPSIAGRLVDLSYAAARQLDMVQIGVTRVKIELLAAPLLGYPRSQKDFPEPSEPLPSIVEHLLPEGEDGTPSAAEL